MARHELNAAGITDPQLRASYERCRQLNSAHGRTYYLATLLLPPAKRPAVHALYGFARYADELVDDLASPLDVDGRRRALSDFGHRFLADLDRGVSDDPICRAVVHTATTWRIPRGHFEAFLESMAMDLTVTEYATFDDLRRYVYGSAAVIGLQMLPILEPIDDRAGDYAQTLGIAFQLANFVRDVGEDLDRGRLYLPLEDLAAAGLSRRDLERRVVDDRVRVLLAGQVQRVRRLADESRPGVAMLAPSSRPCIDAARTLYCGIVDEVERIDYQVFTQRATVPWSRRLAVAVPAWRRAVVARRGTERAAA